MATPHRFVVLHHTDYGEPHFDLMLEVDADGELLTWRCPVWPIVTGGACLPLPPHRRVYLTYEGAVSGGRGVVRRVATGTYERIYLSASHLAIRLDGQTTPLLLPWSGLIPDRPML